MADAELERLRQSVDCRLILERAGWLLDAKESTRLAAKYRSGPGRIVIVTHDGGGWFDPLGEGRGDAIALAQFVWGGNLGHARKVLRPLAGISPERVPAAYTSAGKLSGFDASSEWRRKPLLKKGSPAWRYLTEARALPANIVSKAVALDQLREGYNGTALMAHRGRGTGGTNDAEAVVGWEMRGPNYKGFAKGGSKSLFAFGREGASHRVVVTESAIDVLSLAALEGEIMGTCYVSTGGGFGPAAVASLRSILGSGVRLVAATDRGVGGDLLAQRLEHLASDIGCGFSRARPVAKDWNEQLGGGVPRPESLAPCKTSR
jgi:hypothetical protein